MARTVKKKKELTLEEKLEHALIPVEEQPYQVPENWCWTQGINIFSPMETQRPVGEKFKYIDIDSIDNKRQLVSTPKEMLVTDAPSRASRKLHQGDTVFSMVRPYLKNIAYIDGSIADSIASTGFYVCTPRLLLNPRYCYYLMVSPYVIDGLNAFMKGDNSPSIRKSDLENFVYPLPPLSEQQRIVDRIESLFAKLDEAKEKAQAVVDGFEDRKAAILHKAFTGELTAGWRTSHNIKASTWHEVALSDVLSIVKDKYDPAKDELTIIPYIGLEHFESGKGITSQGKSSDVKSLKTLFNSGDILYGKLRPYLDKHDVPSFNGMCSTDILVYRVKEDNLAYFFNYLMGSYSFIEYANSKSKGINLPRTSEKDISAYRLKVPYLEEQAEIVSLLNCFIDKEQQAKEAAEQVISQIDTMKKSILARAFRGELGTNDPAEESAVEMLKRIL